MQEAEGKRGNQEPKPKQKLPKQSFSLSQVQLSQNDALSLSKPCAQQVFQKSNKSPPCSINSIKKSPPCWHMHTSSLKRPKSPPEAETPPEQMLCNECDAGGVSESIQGYKDMSNI